MIARFRWPGCRLHADVMTLGKLAMDIWAAAVVLSLASIAAFFVAALAVSVRTVAAAGRRARALREQARPLARCCSVRALAELDDDLDRFWESHRGLGQTPGEWAGRQ